MGRIFEKRKYKMFARYARMAKQFTRVGREISIAAKQGGPDPELNPRLRMAIQNAKAINMPKANIEAAIKRATNKEEKDFEEVVYEAYAPHGVALIIVTATDNPNRTVANLRMHLNRAGGSLTKSGSLDFIFEHKAIFKVKSQGQNLEELELELIDYGLEELNQEEDMLYIITPFKDNAAMQKALEEKGLEIVSSEFVYVPNPGATKEDLTEEQQNEVLRLIEKLEEDDDVQHVFHNMA
ncbi:MAG: YebC/PmpR family DNA-binding transcriptional regulator [Flavobacteriales bacterium]|nr:YebC/PmpR family DNA-binding transcriptional regulator [Flavobacteriales bacterium]MCX7768511.1 YebC/PmpR family DNA-binding transcriptional regulator [Flavobacteriales bacterium]